MTPRYPNLGIHPADPDYDVRYDDINEWYDAYDEACEEREEMEREERWVNV